MVNRPGSRQTVGRAASVVNRDFGSVDRHVERSVIQLNTRRRGLNAFVAGHIQLQQPDIMPSACNFLAAAMPPSLSRLPSRASWRAVS
jgi:hypothetical protein